VCEVAGARAGVQPAVAARRAARAVGAARTTADRSRSMKRAGAFQNVVFTIKHQSCPPSDRQSRHGRTTAFQPRACLRTAARFHLVAHRAQQRARWPAAPAAAPRGANARCCSLATMWLSAALTPHAAGGSGDGGPSEAEMSDRIDMHKVAGQGQEGPGVAKAPEGSHAALLLPAP
jgi:hypothetical protein